MFSTGHSRTHRPQTTNSISPRICHVHATLKSTGVGRYGGDGETTQVSITRHADSHNCSSSRSSTFQAGSPPFADATDSDDNSGEEIGKGSESVPMFSHKSAHSCSNQPQYCSMQCYKAAQLKSRYISKLNLFSVWLNNAILHLSIIFSL